MPPHLQNHALRRTSSSIALIQKTCSLETTGIDGVSLTKLHVPKSVKQARSALRLCIYIMAHIVAALMSKELEHVIIVAERSLRQNKIGKEVATSRTQNFVVMPPISRIM